MFDQKRYLKLVVLLATLPIFGLLLSCGGVSGSSSQKAGAADATSSSGKAGVKTSEEKGSEMTDEVVKTDEEWRKELTPEQYYVTRQKGTERAFTGSYYDLKEKGVYRCVCCGNELFSSDK